jgi:nitroimidazol reductase NimA-like FMN-containing flavoprotein (pyridoxamine 5'-phosphate oxidase superfamily)
MVIQEMTRHDCRAMLARTGVARLACASNQQPYIVPIHVMLDGDFLYAYSTVGQKIDWMRENPLVCVEIDEFIAHAQWTSVVVVGRYEELPAAPGYEGSRQIAERLFSPYPAWWEPASVPLAGGQLRSPIVFRIQIGSMTGRRASPDPARPMTGHGDRLKPEPSQIAALLRRVAGRHRRWPLDSTAD